MTQMWRRLIVRTLDALALCAGFATVLLLLSSGETATWRALLPLTSLALCVPLGFAPRKLRMPLVVALSALTGLLGWSASPATDASRIVFAAVSAAIPLIAMPTLGIDRMLCAQVGLLLVQLVANVLSRTPALTAFASFLTTCGCVQLILFLLYLNRSQLRAQCGEKRSTQLTTGNLGMLLVLCVAIFALANVTSVWNALKTAVVAIIRWLGKLFSAVVITGPVEKGGNGDLSQLLELGQGQTSPIWGILELIAKALAVALAAYLLYRLIRIAPRLFRRLAERLRRLLARYRSAVNADYVDETRSLDDSDARRSRALLAAKRRRKRAERMPDWKKLSLRGQVRAAYRLLRSRADVEDHLTARELLYGPLAAPELADAYDRARYSTHEISPEDAEAARKALTAARARR